jgi:predicted pyridoxine 5'-phosphate oxidase superfamily flavin-nucleotide-binding protein
VKRPVSDIAFTPAVKAAQTVRGSRTAFEKMEQRGGWQNRVTAELAEFIADRDSFYLGTVNSDGHPYIQHRGGPKGCLTVLDDRTLAFADFVGNAQYISVGNLDENDKVFLFLMDYPNRRRIKIWGTAKVIEDDQELLNRLADKEYRAKPERAFVITISAWDINCPQHITPRWTEEEFTPRDENLQRLTKSLERENQRLREELSRCCMSTFNESKSIST